jgi:hypothetical protein
MKKVTLLFLLILFATFNVYAQDTNYANGIIRDAFLNTPLPDVKLTLMTEDSTFIKDVEVTKVIKASTGKVEYAMFYIPVECGKKYLLRGSQDGYDDTWLSFNVPMEKGVQFNAGDLELRKSRNINLKEVTVTATKVKMFYKGDTLVYNADAFQLPDGSMLDDLVRQLPGVNLNNNGEIFVNGRKVDELILGSRSFFRGNSKVLLDNLPYYTVKDLKVYEKQSDRSKALGFDIDPRKYVMDVNLKQEYNHGIISNVEVAGGTEKRYLGRGFILGFSDPYRFTLLGNINNVNENRHIGKENRWTPASAPKSLLTTRSVAGEFSFRSPNEKYEENLNVDYTRSKDESEVQERSELFLSGATPLTLSRSSAMNKTSKLSLHNNFKFLKPYFLSIDFDYNRSTHSGNSSLLSEQWNDTLTNRIRNIGMSQGNDWDFHTHWSGTLPINFGAKSAMFNSRGYFNYIFDLHREMNDNEQMQRYDFDKPFTTPQHNVNDYKKQYTKTFTWLTFGWFDKHKINYSIEEQFNTINERTEDMLYHPDTLLLPSQQDALLAITDFSNSYSGHYKKQYGTTIFRVQKMGVLTPEQALISLPYDYAIWEAEIRVVPYHQTLDYQRGILDTLVASTRVLLEPTFKSTLFPKRNRKHELNFAITHRFAPVSLYDRITYRDDSQPLVVKLGNPDLKDGQRTYANADYYARGNNQKQFHLGISFNYMHRATAQAVTYSPMSGVYTYRPENVSGNYNAIAKMDFSRALGEKRYWSVQTNGDANYYHSVDHTMLAGETESRLNKVNTLTLHDGASIQYDHKKLNLRASGDIRWRHSEGKMLDFETLNALDYQYGLSGRYTIPVINMTISADANMYSRRGYGSSTLNTDDFVVNASISQPLFKGKLIARIEAFDLFHNLSSTRYEVNAQGRTETWYRSLPHYVMAHVVYHWNKNPKKK